MSALLDFFSAATIRRLWYILDQLEETALADNLYGLLKSPGKQIRKVEINWLELTGHVEGSSAFSRYREIDKEIKTNVVKLLDD